MLLPNISNWKAYIILHSCVICALIQGIEITLYFYTDRIHNYTIVKLHIPNERDTLYLEHGFTRIQNTKLLKKWIEASQL